ncbi:ABC transporter ATP-binding protein [Galactobacillus timonensis]|uniref:ABC transporter ATP-binding protein n=1 Tax=Galactobacillus timonensis TaxID=2041840 RepID=UPI000C84FB0A|nr:ABC transporter ATP-binding protein [Galactobacillus timonensis]
MFRLMKQIMTRHQYFLLVLTVIFVLGQVGYTLRMPDYMEMITELVETGSGTSSDIVHSGLLMLGCALAAAASAILAQLFSEKLSASFSRDLRKKIYEHIEAFSLAEMDSFSTASLITRSTNDVTQIQNFLSRGLRFAIMAVTYAVWAMVKIANHYPAWTKLTVIAMVFMWLIIIFLINYAHPRLRKRQEYTDRLSRVLRENLTGIYVIRANNAEDYQEQKFEHENDVLAESERKAHHAMSLMRPAIKFTSNMLMAGIYLTGASMIAAAGAAEQLTVFSSMVVFSSYTASLIQSFMNLNGALNMYPRAAISADRIKEVLSHSPSIKDAADPVSPAPEGCLEFRHVSFTYPGTRRKALDDICFKVEKGKTLAIIGSTGSGKTTLVNLIPRLYDADEGEILVDGVDVKNIAQKELRSRIGYAAQKATLLSGTVASNVHYGKHESKMDTHQALEIAQAAEFTDRMEGKDDAPIARGGSNVSGGQKQRISIARAILRTPEFYIFDDAFSALDYKTDRALRAALKKETAGITTVLVSQRIETIRDADDIIVLDEGRIVGQGTHSQLLKNCSLYQQIAATQYTEA